MNEYIYLAPMEGITGSIYRAAQLKYFGGVDKYFTPFISASSDGKTVLTHKTKEDVLPQFNIGQRLVPQILASSAAAFVGMCKALEQLGYTEFNLNLGCPSGTVCAKGKGSGFLRYTDKLELFLDDIFKSGYKISIKTRIGWDNPEEFYTLLHLYNQYPLTELIIHPRTRTDMYKNKPNKDIYAYVQANTAHNLCYNGDVFTKADFERIVAEFPKTKAIMLGRGVLMNPALPRVIKGGADVRGEELNAFVSELMDNYGAVLHGETPLLHKLKELLGYILLRYDNPKLTKKIKKAKGKAELKAALDELFALA